MIRNVERGAGRDRLFESMAAELVSNKKHICNQSKTCFLFSDKKFIRFGQAEPLFAESPLVAKIKFRHQLAVLFEARSLIWSKSEIWLMKRKIIGVKTDPLSVNFSLGELVNVEVLLSLLSGCRKFNIHFYPLCFHQSGFACQLFIHVSKTFP